MLKKNPTTDIENYFADSKEQLNDMYRHSGRLAICGLSVAAAFASALFIGSLIRSEDIPTSPKLDVTQQETQPESFTP